MTDYTISNYYEEDFAEYDRLHREAEAVGPDERYPSSQRLSEQLRAPGYSPEQDLFVVSAGTRIAGYIDVVSEPQIGRVILNCLVHPEHRRQGLAAGLLSAALSRATELGAGVAQVCARQQNVTARSALAKLGFKSVRYFFQMKVAIDRIDQAAAIKAARLCRHLRPGEEEALTELQNVSFAGSWGYHPNTVEERCFRLGQSWCSLHDVLLADDDHIIRGYCWTRPASENGRQIYMIGVHPDFQGRGIGRRVLLAGLAHLKSSGCPVAELNVDAANGGACALYRSVGFSVEEDILWYEKKLS